MILKKKFLFTIFFLLGFLVPITASYGQTSADLVDVTVTILRVVERHCDEEFGERCPNDYYARVNIAEQGYEKSPRINNNANISPHWVFTSQVDRGLGIIPVDIQIKDQDDFSADDAIDISFGGDRTLNLFFNLNTGDWYGEVPLNQPLSYGLLADSAKIIFDIRVNSDGDIDDDGIPDSVELNGIYDPDDGKLITDMAALGADPCRKTIAVEIDFMELLDSDNRHSHEPDEAAIEEVVKAFSEAPIPAVSSCPYPGFPTKARGINLIVDEYSRISEIPTLGLGKEFEEIKALNFNPERRPYFHYSLWVHDSLADSSQSGVCCSGKDFIVSLGSWENQNGSVRQQSGTFMHELGHALGLGHGGGDGVNYKPNYLSVMSNAFQTVGITDGATGIRQIDYSRANLPVLTENSLNEPAGIGDGTLITIWQDLTSTWRSGLGNRPLDWTGNDFDGNGNNRDDTNVTVDINNDDQITQLNGFNDWANIKYRAVMSLDANGVSRIYDEITFAEAQVVESAWDAILVPVVNAGPNQVVDEGDVVYLNLANFIDPSIDSNTRTATIDWGDGSLVELGTVAESGNSGTISGEHAYADNGIFTIIVTVCDEDNHCGSDSLTVTVNNVLPTVNSGFDQIVFENEATFLSAQFTDPGTADTHTAVSLSPHVTILPSYDFDAEGEMIVINGWKNEYLQPGSYGHLIVGGTGEVHLSSGQYTFSHLSLRRWSTMYFDLSDGPIIIDIDGTLITQTGVNMVIESDVGQSDDIMFRVEGNVTLGERGNFIGTYIAPEHQIKIQKKANLEGALYSNVVTIGQSVTIIGNPAIELFVNLHIVP